MQMLNRDVWNVQAVMADEVGQVRMQVQLEKEALERARTQRAADRYLLLLLLSLCDKSRLVCLKALMPGPACDLNSCLAF